MIFLTDEHEERFQSTKFADWSTPYPEEQNGILKDLIESMSLPELRRHSDRELQDMTIQILCQRIAEREQEEE